MLRPLKILNFQRLDEFHNEHPDMFLPPDIDTIEEEIIGNSNLECSATSPTSSHTSVEDDDSFPKIEVYSRRKTSRKSLSKRFKW